MEKIEKIRLMIKEPGKPARVEEVDHTIEKMQEIVGGRIDCAQMPGTDDIDIFFDDEGLNYEKPANVWLAGSDNCIMGTIYFVGYKARTGESVSLTDKQIKQCEKYIENFAIPDCFNIYSPDYYLISQIMNSKSKKYLQGSFEEM